MELLLMAIAISIGLAIVILFVLPPLIFWIKKHFGMHAWSYRNPFERTCVKCGRRKVAYSRPWSMNTWWWETHVEGNGNHVVCIKTKD